jgi:hypothetical protein
VIDVCSHFHQITLQGASSLQSNDLYVNHQGILQRRALMDEFMACHRGNNDNSLSTPNDKANLLWGNIF